MSVRLEVSLGLWQDLTTEKGRLAFEVLAAQFQVRQLKQRLEVKR